MSEKRKRDSQDDTRSSQSGSKRARKGIQVGPANLPDGVHRRKTQEIKRSLIEKAQIKKQYAKLKQQDQADNGKDIIPTPASMQDEHTTQARSLDEGHDDDAPESSETTHPARQAMISRVSPSKDDEDHSVQPLRNAWERPRRRPKSIPFKREHEQAQKRKEEAEARRQAREYAERERQQRIVQRARLQKAMAKARVAGPNGQRKLGRESNVLLEKVKRMVGNSG